MQARTHRAALAAVVVVAAMLATAATCGKHPKHTATLSLNGFAHALMGVQDAEIVLYNAGKVPLLIHQTIQRRILSIATLANEAQTTLDAWQPGQPVPTVLGPVLVAAKDLVTDITALLPLSDTLKAQIDEMYSAITDILILLSQ
ncbi:MAG: hypothetical protein PHR30_16590 [Gallionellaceae bacterium]|nr:hypothetical protein [Gallionellaceae bacterium]